MVDHFMTKIVDILIADSTTLLHSGTAWGTAFPGVVRVSDDPNPLPGHVNIYERSYEQQSGNSRPAIYMGNRGMDFQDDLEFDTVAGDGRAEYRLMVIPIVVVTNNAKPVLARKMRDQLRFNIKKILFKNLFVNGYWYEMRVKGQGAIQERGNTSTSGGGDTNVAESIVVIPVQIKYIFNLNSSP